MSLLPRTGRCPNCGNHTYTETVSKEKCTSCGLLCDYWGGGTNAVYDAMTARQYAAEERTREQRDRQWDKDNGYD
jgi:hypothetical protein